MTKHIHFAVYMEAYIGISIDHHDRTKCTSKINGVYGGSFFLNIFNELVDVCSTWLFSFSIQAVSLLSQHYMLVATKGFLFL